MGHSTHVNNENEGAEMKKFKPCSKCGCLHNKSKPFFAQGRTWCGWCGYKLEASK